MVPVVQDGNLLRNFYMNLLWNVVFAPVFAELGKGCGDSWLFVFVSEFSGKQASLLLDYIIVALETFCVLLLC